MGSPAVDPSNGTDGSIPPYIAAPDQDPMQGNDALSGNYIQGADALGGGRGPQQQPQVDTESTPSTSMIPNVDSPTYTPQGRDYQPQEQSFAGKVLGTIAKALGGSNTTTVRRDPTTGNIEITAPPSTPAEQSRNLIRAALEGMGAGAGVAPGPGSKMRALGAGIQAGFADAKQQQQQARDQANQDFEFQSKAQLQNAQLALLGTQNAQAAFNLQQGKVQALQGYADHTNAMQTLIGQNPNNRIIGHVQDPSNLSSLKDSDPNVIKDFYAGKVHLEIHHNDDGSFGGFDVYHIDPDWKTQLNKQPVQLMKMVPGVDGKPPTVGFDTIPANAMSNGDIMLASAARNNEVLQAQMALHKQSTDDQKAASEIAMQRSEGVKNYAEANSANATAAATRASMPVQAGGSGNAPFNPSNAFDSIAMKLADGTMLESQLPNRNAKGQPTKQQYIARAEQLSQQAFAKPYDPAVIAQENHFASSEKTQAYFGATGRLLGAQGANPGLLDQLVDAAQKAGLTDNTAANAARIAAATNPALALTQTAAENAAIRNFITVRNEVQRSISTAAGNPLIASSDSDIKLKQMEQTVGSTPTLSNLRGEAQTLKTSIAQERNTALANNRFLQRRFGASQQQQQQQQPRPGGGQPQSGTIPTPPRPANIPANYAFIQDSQGGTHWIPQQNLAAAKQRDPGLKVGQ